MNLIDSSYLFLSAWFRRLLTTYIVNTMPPLNISRPSRGRAPDQKVNTPSSRNIRAAQAKLLRYSFFASIDCILVLIVSSGMVT